MSREIIINHPKIEDKIGGDRGYKVDSFSIWEGDVIAYLKTAYIPSENWKKLCPTPYHFQCVHGGWCGELEGVESRPEIFKTVYRRLNVNLPDPSTNLYTRKEIDDIFDDFEDSYQYRLIVRRMKVMKEQTVGKPWIDYSNVNQRFQRQGIGTMLYKAAARFHHSSGRRLRASTLQSDPAKAIWNSFTQKGWTEEGVIGDRDVLYLDPDRF